MKFCRMMQIGPAEGIVVKFFKFSKYKMADAFLTVYVAVATF